MDTEQNGVETTDIHGDLAAAFAEMDTGGDEVVEDVSAADEVDVTDEVADVSDDGDELTEEEIAEAMAEIEADSEIAAPDHWSQEDRDMFAALSEIPGGKGKEVQEFLMRRHKEMEADYTKKTMAISDERKEFEAYRPIQEQFKQAGIVNPAETIQGWMNIAVNLHQDPLGTLQYLARQHGVDLTGQEGENQPNGEVFALQNQIRQLQQQITQRDQQQQSAQLSEIEQKIQAFASETGEDGKPKHPYFEQVEAEMAVLANGYRASGQPVPELSELYERAIRANPQVFAQQQQAERAQAELRKKAEAIAKAKRAKRDGKSIQSGGSANFSESADDASLRDMIASQF